MAACVAISLPVGCRKAEGPTSTAVVAAPRSSNPDEAPNARLEALVQNEQDGRAGPAPLPWRASPQTVSGVRLSVTGASASHSLPVGKVTLTSEELIVRLEVSVANEDLLPHDVDLGGAQLVGGPRPRSLARDAQAAEERPLHFSVAPKDKTERALYFEVPDPEILAKLALVLPAGGLGPAAARMELRQ